ncbi:hypothetical protein DPMN_140331 [Dreissena polymorpha]|uniref:Uncharacterized protein n=1 Tax=Dreissena polymorpha TaxID=45954 RepID=A0A9D4G7E6_DREPO|nr:hypothetical protein DPMN_140331 [Dreissena polymorpha]
MYGYLITKLRSWSFVYVLLLAVMDVQTVSLGDVCTKDEDCSSLTNSYCAKMYECTSGTCACKTGYGSATGQDCIKKLSSYYQYCDSDYYCNGVNQTCTSGKCQCAEWNEWSDLARMCKWQEGELLTESCGPVYSRCFWQSSYGGQCSGVRAGYCGCATGTVLDISYSFVACRKPRLGEHCESSPLCESHFDTKSISDDASNFRPTCQDNVCACPKSHELVSVKGWKLCLSKFDDELVANGEQCKNWSQCQSRFCVKCPGASSGVCMNKSRSSLRMSSIEQIAVMTLILLCNIS